MSNKIHEGRNVRRFREMRELKQEALAFELGEDWNQQKISLLEQKRTIDPAILAEISRVLHLPVEVFQQFDEEQGINHIIANTFNSHDSSTLDAYIGNSSPIFNINPIKEVQQLHEEKIAIYERMLKEKDSMMTELKKLMEKK